MKPPPDRRRSARSGEVVMSAADVSVGMHFQGGPGLSEVDSGDVHRPEIYEVSEGPWEEAWFGGSPSVAERSWKTLEDARRRRERRRCGESAGLICVVE